MIAGRLALPKLYLHMYGSATPPNTMHFDLLKIRPKNNYEFLVNNKLKFHRKYQILILLAI